MKFLFFLGENLTTFLCPCFIQNLFGLDSVSYISYPASILEKRSKLSTLAVFTSVCLGSHTSTNFNCTIRYSVQVTSWKLNKFLCLQTIKTVTNEFWKREKWTSNINYIGIKCQISIPIFFKTLERRIELLYHNSK